MRELSVAGQRYEAVRAVLADGETVTSVAARFGVARKTVHVWLVKYEAGGLDGLADGSHRPRSCPHQMPAAVEVALVELRLAHPWWGPRRLSFELGKRGVQPPVSESAAYRALARLNLVDPAARPRDRKWKRWERGTAMELWQMDVVGGFALADGTRAKALTGVDDHSRFCVSAHRRRCALTVSPSGRQRGACSPSFGYRVGDCLVPGDLPITPGVEVGL
jgi:transposase